MKDGLRFVDCDMHVMEPADIFDRYLDPRFKDRVTVPTGADGRPKGGVLLIDGLPRTMDDDTQQYRKPTKSVKTAGNQPLSGSRSASTGRLDFAIERGYDGEAQGLDRAL